MHECIIALRSLFTLTLLTGMAYPLLVTGLGQLANAEAVQGSLLKQADKTVGSLWLAQPFQRPEYFWPRPSAGNYATVASGASNKGPTSKDLKEKVQARRAILLQAHALPEKSEVPPELLMASGSGLDPHLSPEAARFQIKRVALARGLQAKDLESLLQKQIEPPQLGFLGAPRVNVLKLNLALDQSYSVAISKRHDA